MLFKQRRRDKEVLLKLRDDSNNNYTIAHTKFMEKEKELTQVLSDIKQLGIDEEKYTKNLISLKKELVEQYKQYNIKFDDLTYRDNYKVLNNKKETFIIKQINSKDLETQKNQKALAKNELETKLAATKTLLQTEANTKTNYEQFIKEQKDKSTTILNIVHVDKYEIEVNATYETIQVKEKRLSEELTKTKTKDEELQKQEKQLSERITSNKLSCEQLKQKLDVELTTNDFEDIEAFKKAILPKEQREKMSSLCKSIDEKYNSYKTLQIDTLHKLTEHKKEEIKVKPIDEVVQELQELQSKNR